MQNGAGRSCLFSECGTENGVAQVDEVKIDAVRSDIGEVCPAEIGFANFLGAFEAEVFVVIGVEAGFASFARVRTVDEATARSPCERMRD